MPTVTVLVKAAPILAKIAMDRPLPVFPAPIDTFPALLAWSLVLWGISRIIRAWFALLV